jgi:N-acetylglucosaminyl-diphospho-decaprenol L-rhamnosyltransferase
LSCDLSIVIVNWNTRDKLRDCLASLVAATSGLAVLTVVVDNASSDGSADMVRDEFPACWLIESGGNLGFARANNLALAQAETPQILLLNPDTVCPAGSLTALSAYLAANARVAVVGPQLVDETGRPAASYGNFPREWHHLVAAIDPRRTWMPGELRRAGLGRTPAPDQLPGPVEYVKGACFLLRREVLEQIGPLDERFFMYFEECDWCRRANAAGYEVHLLPAVKVKHLEGCAAAQVSDFSLVQFQASYRMFIAKHYGRRRLPGFRLAQLLEYSAKGMLRAIAPGDRQWNRQLARRYRTTAGLQLRNRLEPRPPG